MRFLSRRVWRRSEAKMTGHLKSELGRADWQGQIAFKDIPRYELTFSANQLDIQKLSSGQTIKGNLNLAGLVKGSGLTLAAMNTLAKIDLQRSTLGQVELEQGTLVATIADQRIRVAQGMLKATDATLSVKGDIGTDLKQQGRLDYQLRVKTLSPWLALHGPPGFWIGQSHRWSERQSQRSEDARQNSRERDRL